MTRRPCPELSKESGAAARTACACLAAAGIAWVSFGSNIPSDSPSNSPNDSPSGSPGDTEAQPSDGEIWQTVKRRWWQELPDTPSAPTVEPASPESLLVTWEAPDSTTDIAAYHVEFRVHDASGSTVREPAGSETGTTTTTDTTDTIITTDTTVTIDGLMSSTLYHVRVRAVNDAGPGDWSAPGTGMTENAAPVFLEGDATTRTLPENSPGAYEIGAPVAASDADGDTLTYGLGSADAQAFAIDAATGQLATRPDYSYDHEANPSHALAVTAADGHGNQAEIALTVHVTDVLEPPLQPDPPTVAPTGIDALTVSWTAPPNTGRPDITRYNLRYSGSGRPFTLWSETPTGTRVQITGLQEDRYEVQVRGVNDEGDGAWSASGHGTVVINRPPNLVVTTLTVNDANLDPGETFTLSATVANTGEGDSPATTLRYYRSTDDSISRSDAQVGTDAVGALSASGTSAASISLSAPAGAGTYYYGACVDAVADESDTADNCSSAVRVDVATPNRSPNLVVNTLTVDDANLDPGETFTLSATVANTGAGESPATTLRYYRSTDDSISRSDAQVGTDAVGALSASGTSAASISLSAPAGAGTYHYGACVDAVADESNTSDNCSSSVRVDVARPPNLVVNTLTVDDANPDPGATFTLSATVANAGAGDSPATTLRYYRSTDATISRSDAQVGTDAVNALSASGTSVESISLSAPGRGGDLLLRGVRGRRGGRVEHVRQLFVIRTGRRGDGTARVPRRQGDDADAAGELAGRTRDRSAGCGDRRRRRHLDLRSRRRRRPGLLRQRLHRSARNPLEPQLRPRGRPFSPTGRHGERRSGQPGGDRRHRPRFRRARTAPSARCAGRRVQQRRHAGGVLDRAPERRPPGHHGVQPALQRVRRVIHALVRNTDAHPRGDNRSAGGQLRGAGARRERRGGRRVVGFRTRNHPRPPSPKPDGDRGQGKRCESGPRRDVHAVGSCEKRRKQRLAGDNGALLPVDGRHDLAVGRAGRRRK